MNDSQADVVVVTETWLSYSVLNAFQGVRVAQSPHLDSKGVMVLTGPRVSNLQALVPSLWTAHSIFLKARVRDLNDSLTVVAHYSQPGQKQVLDEELRFAFRVMRLQQRLKQVVLAGDLNRPANQARALAASLDLEVCQDERQSTVNMHGHGHEQDLLWRGPADQQVPKRARSKQLVTRVNPRNPANSKQLDYILCNFAHEGAFVEPANWQDSDHRPLSCIVLPEKLPRQGAIKFREETRLRQNLSQAQLRRVLSSPAWPDEPFVAVAKKLDLTYTVRIPLDCTYQLRRYVKNVVGQSESTAMLVEDTLSELQRQVTLSLKAKAKENQKRRADKK